MKLFEVADFLKASYVGDGDIEIDRVNDLENGKKNESGFLEHEKIMQSLKNTQLGAIIVKRPLDSQIPLIIHPQPIIAAAQLINLFQPVEKEKKSSESAIVSYKAKLDKSVILRDFVVIEDDVTIGKNSYIHAHAWVGKGVVVGDNVVIGAGSKIYPKTVLKNNIHIGPQCVIGYARFGYSLNKDKEWVHIPQNGGVVVEDDVSMHSFVSIDSGTFQPTVIQKGVKLDAHVHIAHNVNLGENVLICGQSGVAGSSKIGKNSIIAGQSGVSNGLTVADHVTIGARSGVLQSIEKQGYYLGSPAIEASLWKRLQIHLKNLPNFLK